MTNGEKSAFAEMAGHTNRIADELEGQGSLEAVKVRRIAHAFEHLAGIPQMVPDKAPHPS
jgi:hypothetical protein